MDFEVTRFVNNELIDALSFYTDDSMYEDLGNIKFDMLIPKGCYRDKNFIEERKIEEVFDLLRDNFLREKDVALTPVNENILSKLIRIIIEINIDDEETFQIVVPENLKQQILCCDSYYSYEEVDDNPEHNFKYNFVLSSITKWDNYLEVLFQDWDFDEEMVNAITIKFLNKNKCNTLGLGYDYLLESQELMSDDLYFKFKEYIKMNTNEKSHIIEINGNNNNVEVGDKCERTINFNKKQEDKCKKNWFEKYGIASIIVAIIGLVVAIIQAIY